MNGSLTIISVLTLGSVALAEQNPEELKQRVLAQAQSISPEDYAFTRTVRTDSVSSGKTEQKVLVEKFDPTKPADARWTLVSLNGAAPSADELSQFRKESLKRRLVPGYHRVANYFGAPATVANDARGVGSLPKGTVSVMESDVSQNASAEVSISDGSGSPFAEQVHITVKPIRLKLIMKLDRFEMVARYRMGPDGKPILIESTTDLSGSGMGQEGTMKSVATYSDYRRVSGTR